MHMREAIDKLMSDFNKFLEENAGFKGGWVFCLSIVECSKLMVCVTGKVLRVLMI